MKWTKCEEEEYDDENKTYTDELNKLTRVESFKQ